jgi:hypothetical protein
MSNYIAFLRVLQSCIGQYRIDAYYQVKISHKIYILTWNLLVYLIRAWERVFSWAVNGQYLFAWNVKCLILVPWNVICSQYSREAWLSIKMLREMRIKDVCFVNCDFASMFISIYFIIFIIDMIRDNQFIWSHSIAQE